jgi:hypothetical protein
VIIRDIQFYLNYNMDKTISLVYHQLYLLSALCLYPLKNFFYNYYNAMSFCYLPYNIVLLFLILIITYPLMEVISN